jgi:hypothetical protein
MLRRGLFLVVAAAAAMLGGCGVATVGAGLNAASKLASSPTVQRVARPAIVATELAIAAKFSAAEAAVDRAVEAGTISGPEAVEVAKGASELNQALAVGRLAYDMTFRASAGPETNQLVDEARAATDAVYDRLQAKLAGVVLSSPPEPEPSGLVI